MLIPKKITGTKRIIFTTLLVVILVVIAYLLFVNFVRPRLQSAGNAVLPPGMQVFQAPQLNPVFETDFLSTSQYSGLKQHGVLPVTVERTGRSNPFLPIIIAPPVPTTNQ